MMTANSRGVVIAGSMPSLARWGGLTGGPRLATKHLTLNMRLSLLAAHLLRRLDGVNLARRRRTGHRITVKSSAGPSLQDNLARCVP
jgi:hypothetical protein